MKTECVYCEVRMKNLKMKFNEFWTLTIMKSGAYHWLKCEFVGTVVWRYGNVLECWETGMLWAGFDPSFFNIGNLPKSTAFNLWPVKFINNNNNNNNLKYIFGRVFEVLTQLIEICLFGQWLPPSHFHCCIFTAVFHKCLLYDFWDCTGTCGVAYLPRTANNSNPTSACFSGLYEDIKRKRQHRNCAAYMAIIEGDSKQFLCHQHYAMLCYGP